MKTKALIIEDEFSAAEYLKHLLTEIDSNIVVTNTLASISDSISWLNSNEQPDLIFLDINLADGSSFSIFKHVNITCPIIFVTAYDQYAIQAFEVNSIGYLLKPISHEDIRKAIDKFHKNRLTKIDYSDIISKISDIGKSSIKYKKNFLVQVKDKLIPIEATKTAYFYTESKIVRAVTENNQEYIINNNIEEIMTLINPEQFFRANRQFIVNRNFIKEAIVWFNGKLIIKMEIDSKIKIELSRARVSEFKSWFGN